MYKVVNSSVAQVFGTAPRAPVHCRKFDRDTCLPQNISFWQYSRHIWVRWKILGGKSDHAYSKNLEGNALRETYPDLWHINLVKRCRWQHVVARLIHGGMATGLQGTDNAVGLPNVCFICLLFSSRRISDQHKNGSCRLGFGLSQQWVWGAVFACWRQM